MDDTYTYGKMDSPKLRYQFRPLVNLRSIRVLVLHPATNDDEDLVAHIEHEERRTLDDNFDLQDYEAVSYTWGIPDMSKTLICDGAILSITENVDIMLRRLRTPRPRRLWIDAICLNQADNEEKRSQVPLMTEIYRESSNVIIWLGDATPAELQAVTAIRKSMLVGLEQVAVDQDAMIALFNMLARPWFTRRWILQEAKAHSNTTVILGSDSFSWIELMQVSKMVQSLSSRITETPAITKTSIGIVTALHESSSEWWSRMPHTREHPLLNLLDIFSDSECSDHRDRINALLGLVPESTWVPDYTAHWTGEYERLARRTLSMKHGFEVIEWHILHFGIVPNSDPKFPPWVPNWSHPRSSAPPRSWRERIAIADAWGLKQEAGFWVHLNEHLNSLRSRQFVRHSRQQQERYTTSHGSLRIIPREAHGDPASLLTTLIVTISQCIDIQPRGLYILTTALAYLFSELLPLKNLFATYFVHEASNHQYFVEFFLKWFGYLLRQKSPELTRGHYIDSYMFSLGDAFFLNDVVLPCMVEMFSSCTMFWAWDQGGRSLLHRKPRLRAGIIRATKVSLDNVAFHTLGTLFSRANALRRGEALMGKDVPVQALYIHLDEVIPW